MYRAAGQWTAALRVAEAYCPNKVAEVHLEMGSELAQSGQGELFGWMVGWDTGDGLMADDSPNARNESPPPNPK